VRAHLFFSAASKLLSIYVSSKFSFLVAIPHLKPVPSSYTVTIHTINSSFYLYCCCSFRPNSLHLSSILQHSFPFRMHCPGDFAYLLYLSTAHSFNLLTTEQQQIFSTMGASSQAQLAANSLEFPDAWAAPISSLLLRFPSIFMFLALSGRDTSSSFVWVVVIFIFVHFSFHFIYFCQFLFYIILFFDFCPYS